MMSHNNLTKVNVKKKFGFPILAKMKKEIESRCPIREKKENFRNNQLDQSDQQLELCKQSTESNSKTTKDPEVRPN